MSTVAKKVIMGSGAIEIDPLDIEQSLIFQPNAHFSRNVGSASNRKTWTWSAWVKRSALGLSNDQMLFNAGPAGSESDSSYFAIRFGRTDFGAQTDALVVNGWNTNWRITNRLFRDVSAWYHIVVVLDTTQSTADNRIKVYINGTQETSFQTTNNPSQDATLGINLNQYHIVGAENVSGSDRYFNGQMAEVNFIDGTALDPSSFGKTNEATGQWVPIEYSGSYGTNGFRLKFVSGALGTDSSGEGNNYSAANLANTDVVIDTPTNNFCNFSSICGNSRLVVLSEGNLFAPLRGNTTYPGQNDLSGTLATPTSGKWYWEIRYQSSGRSGYSVGMQQVSDAVISNAGVFGYSYYNAGGGQKTFNGTTSNYGAEWFVSNQVYKLSIYYDADLGKIGFKLNGADQGFAFTDVLPAEYVPGVKFQSGNTQNIVNTTGNFGQNGTFCGTETAQGNADANGIGDFYYAPPSGYLALCTANFPAPAIPLPEEQFNTVLYTGNAGTQSISGVGFQPNFVWAKNRSRAGGHGLFDAVRGAGKSLESDSSTAERTQSDSITSFNSDGFSLGDNTEAGPDVNYVNNDNYVAWNWKANGAGSNDTSGDIDATVSANQTAGFSIVNYVPNGTASATVPHGLGVAPEMVFYKRYNSSSQWFCWTTVIDGSDDYLVLDSTDAAAAVSQAGGTSFTSSFIRATNYGASGSPEVVAYCFASKPSFSKISVYTGNGNASGPYVNCGFRPAWVMVKRTDVAKDWIILDVKRDIDNVANHRLFPNLADAEATAQLPMDISSNGFKLRISDSNYNANAGTYLYMAFAESPFKTANAR
jgi:hypothetical protein